MTKPQVAHSIKDRESIKQNEDAKRMKARTLRVSALSLATAMSALGLSQVACAELTWAKRTVISKKAAINKTVAISQTMV